MHVTIGCQAHAEDAALEALCGSMGMDFLRREDSPWVNLIQFRFAWLEDVWRLWFRMVERKVIKSYDLAQDVICHVMSMGAIKRVLPQGSDVEKQVGSRVRRWQSLQGVNPVKQTYLMFFYNLMINAWRKLMQMIADDRLLCAFVCQFLFPRCTEWSLLARNVQEGTIAEAPSPVYSFQLIHPTSSNSGLAFSDPVRNKQLHDVCIRIDGEGSRPD